MNEEKSNRKKTCMQANQPQHKQTLVPEKRQFFFSFILFFSIFFICYSALRFVTIFYTLSSYIKYCWRVNLLPFYFSLTFRMLLFAFCAHQIDSIETNTYRNIYIYYLYRLIFVMLNVLRRNGSKIRYLFRS